MTISERVFAYQILVNKSQSFVDAIPEVRIAASEGFMSVIDMYTRIDGDGDNVSIPMMIQQGLSPKIIDEIIGVSSVVTDEEDFDINICIQNICSDFKKRKVSEILSKHISGELSDTDALDYFSQVLNTTDTSIEEVVKVKDLALKQAHDIAGGTEMYYSCLIPVLDDMVGFPLLKTGVMGIYAAPGQGKSSLMQFMLKNAEINGEKCLVFSVEMPPEVLSIITQTKISGFYDRVTMSTASSAIEALSAHKDSNIWIYNKYITGYKAMVRAIDRWAKKTGPGGYVFVDFIQLVPTEDNNDRSDEKLTAISRGIANACKRNGMRGVFLLSVKKEYHGTGKVPPLDSVLGTGSIVSDLEFAVSPLRLFGSKSGEDSTDVLETDYILHVGKGRYVPPKPDIGVAFSVKTLEMSTDKAYFQKQSVFGFSNKIV